MNFNLIDQLTKEDKIKIENYIYLYGTKTNFIGIDEWLKYWSINKIKMYKLLGNQMIYRVPFKYEKSNEEINNQLSELLNKNNFKNNLLSWIDNHNDVFPIEVYNYIYNCCNKFSFINDKVRDSIKFKLEDSNKMLQLQAGMKPLRALGRFISYCKNVPGADVITYYFEQFRIEHSMILNDKIIEGDVVISIYPLDFLTMSDNNSNWQSCMSWREHGCYHVGTIEMMNSNNVLCCYIENKNPFYFSSEHKGDENYRWYNKKWRQLFYFTKDIIVSGKPYPYVNDDITKAILGIIRDLARKNLKWTYSFGPELYQDMKYLYTKYSMDRARNYIHWGSAHKHNIIFDTKGMYNDMLNDHEREYWCVRNKVRQNKVISLSGKCTCLSCKESIISESGNTYDYNERFYNYGSLVCEKCLDKHRCDLCTASKRIERNYIIQTEQSKLQVCKYCFRTQVKYCPCCGEPMLIDPGLRGPIVVPKNFSAPENQRIKYENWTFFGENYYINVEDGANPANPIFMCQNCLKDKYKKYLSVEKYVNFYNEPVYAPVFKDFHPGEQFYYPNLKSVSIEDVKDKIIHTCADFKVASQIARN